MAGSEKMADREMTSRELTVARLQGAVLELARATDSREAFESDYQVAVSRQNEAQAAVNDLIRELAAVGVNVGFGSSKPVSVAVPKVATTTWQATGRIDKLEASEPEPEAQAVDVWDLPLDAFR